MGTSTNQIVLISFFQFPRKEWIWAMSQMAVVLPKMKRMDGLYFSKMLGTGGGMGYGFIPDFKTYALLTVWDDAKKASDFESDSEIMAGFRKRCNEIYSIFLNPILSRGSWSGLNPFIPSGKASDKGMICVITRATLKFRFYIPFWKRVPHVSKSHEGLPGLLFTKGIGERPWILQATFSVWKSLSDMQSFAYNKSSPHFEAISTTRRLKGFREELFARFQPLESRGTWRGGDPLGLPAIPLKQ